MASGWSISPRWVGPEDVAAEAARVLDIRGAARDATTDAVRRIWPIGTCCCCSTTVSMSSTRARSLAWRCSAPARNLRILATSREPLGIMGEAVWRLEPLRPSMHTACFWSAPGNEVRSWFRMRTQRPPSSTSAPGSTSCRSASSWRPPESASCRRTRSSPVSTPTWVSWAGRGGLHRRTTAAFEPRSSGATPFSILSSRPRFGAWRCSSAVSMPTPPAPSPPACRSTCWPGWWTSR